MKMVAQGNMILQQKLNSVTFGFLKVIKKCACFVLVVLEDWEKETFLCSKNDYYYLRIIKSTSKAYVVVTQKYH